MNWLWSYSPLYILQKPATKRSRRSSKNASKEDHEEGDGEEDFDEGTPPASDNSEDEVSIV